MKKAITTVHTILVITILLATAGWSSYYLLNRRSGNSEAVNQKIPLLAQSVTDSFLENDSLYNNAFSDKIKGIFEQDSDLTALTIYSYDTGVEYFYSRNNMIRIKSPGKSEPAEGGMPAYGGLGFTHSVSSIPLNQPGRPGANIDCVYTVLPSGDIFFALRVSLIVVVVLFCVTLFLILAFSLNGRAAREEEASQPWMGNAVAEPRAEEFTDRSGDNSEEPLPEDEEFGFDSSDDFGLPEDSLSDSSSAEEDPFSLDDLDSLSGDEPAGDGGLDLEDSLDLDDLDSSEAESPLTEGGDFSMEEDSLDDLDDFDSSDLDSLDLGEETDSLSEESLDLEDDFEEESADSLGADLDMDDLNLEDSIPDIPEEEDLLAMDHEETADAEDSLDLDDFDMPEDEGFDAEEPSLGEDDELEGEEPSPEEDLLSDEEDASEEPSLYNPDNGLGWEQFLEERLSLELERAASFDQDLVLILLKNDGMDQSGWDKLAARTKEKYGYSDLVFEAGEKELAIVDPNKDLDEAIEDIQSYLKDLEEDLGDHSTKAGLSSRNGRLISGNRLIREAGTSLNKTDGENPIVGFRSDPERFREFLGKNG